MGDLGLPGSFRSHVAEDCDGIPAQFTISLDDLEDEGTGPKDEPPSLHRALSESRLQGKRPLHVENEKIKMFSIDERQKSFKKDNDEESPQDEKPSPTWEGPPPREMAVAGWEYVDSKKARCCYCQVTVRNWAPDHDAWMLHKVMSPYCRRLRQVGEEGIHPCPKGKKRLIHSFSSYDVLFRPV
ncbi:hypothetical protein V1264_015699 [Littorina saxatilis]|uniref:Uncharacterized protein n=1 Tax=Littorina saxatilis TaxID=31220 RepID=A0AAN9BMI2_9CAEN